MFTKVAFSAGLVVAGSALGSTVPFISSPLLGAGECSQMMSASGEIAGGLLIGGSDPLLLPQIISFGVLPLELPTIDLIDGPDGVTPLDGFPMPVSPTGAPLPSVNTLGDSQMVPGAEIVGSGLRALPVPLPGAGMMAMVGLAAVAGTSRRRRL